MREHERLTSTGIELRISVLLTPALEQESSIGVPLGSVVSGGFPYTDPEFDSGGVYDLSTVAYIQMLLLCPAFLSISMIMLSSSCTCIYVFHKP